MNKPLYQIGLEYLRGVGKLPTGKSALIPIVRELRKLGLNSVLARKALKDYLGVEELTNAASLAAIEVNHEFAPPRPPENRIRFMRINPHNPQSKIANADPANLALACGALGVSFKYNSFKDLIHVEGLPG